MGREIASLLGPALAGGTILPDEPPPAGTALYPTVAALAAACAVIIDFTHPAAVPAHAEACAAAGVAWILGTTGIDPATQRDVARAADRIPVVQSANFSVGVTLLLVAAEQLAAALAAPDWDAEILERHHRGKLDAPSGTALALAAAVAVGRGTQPALRDANRTGLRGDEIGLAAIRGGALVGEHTLAFIGANEEIALSHRAQGRRIFAEGAIRAARWAIGRPPGLYAMRDVLDL